MLERRSQSCPAAISKTQSQPKKNENEHDQIFNRHFACRHLCGSSVSAVPLPASTRIRPVVIGSNGRPLEQLTGPCPYGAAITGIIETLATRLDPKDFPDPAIAKNAIQQAAQDDFNRRKAVRDWTGYTYGPVGMVWTPTMMSAYQFNADAPRCFPRYIKFLNDVTLAQQARQVHEAELKQQREAEEARKRSEHNAQMAELERKRAEEQRKRDAEDAKKRADEAADRAEIEAKRQAELRAIEAEAAKKRVERAAEEEKKRLDHEAEMKEIERQRQAEIERARAEQAEKWRSAVQVAWNVPFVLGADISEDLFKAVDRAVGFDCARQIKNQVKYDIRSPGVLYGTNSGDWAILRFDRWSAKPTKDGTIRIRGDNAEAQNGFGNWLRVNYSCEVDLASKKIVGTTIDMGRLPDLR